MAQNRANASPWVRGQRDGRTGSTDSRGGCWLVRPAEQFTGSAMQYGHGRSFAPQMRTGSAARALALLAAMTLVAAVAVSPTSAAPRQPSRPDRKDQVTRTG